jgi:hypothetical protein
MLLPLVLLNIQCKKKNAEPDLPPVTQSGANTFGCRINGKVFVPKVNAGGYSQRLMSDYLPNSPGNTYSFGVSAYNNSEIPNVIIGFSSTSTILETGKIYQLQATSSQSGFVTTYYEQTGGQGNFRVVAPLTGQLTILKIDLVAKIISGAFFFDATNDKGEKVEIKDGRFDVKYPL